MSITSDRRKATLTGVQASLTWTQRGKVAEAGGQERERWHLREVWKDLEIHPGGRDGTGNKHSEPEPRCG